MVSMNTKALGDLLATGKQRVHCSAETSCIDALGKVHSQLQRILEFTLQMGASKWCSYSCRILVATQWLTQLISPLLFVCNAVSINSLRKTCT